MLNIFFSFSLLAYSLFSFGSEIKMGAWRFELRQTHAVIPFLIELKMEKNRLKGILYNGDEKIPLESIVYAGSKVTIPLQTYESELQLNIVSAQNLHGHWVRLNKSPLQYITVSGEQGEFERFTLPSKNVTIDLNGKWELVLDHGNSKEDAIGVFKQEGQYLSGTIITPSGDYRYLEGICWDNKFKLASFDGAFNMLIEGEIEDLKINAALKSSTLTKISGFKNDEAKLKETLSTQFKNFNWVLNEPTGKKVKLSELIKNKSSIITIMGSWCPNCIDELNFLREWKNKNSKKSIEIIPIAFERSQSKDEANRQILKLQNQKKIPFKIYLAGYTQSDKPETILTGLENFQAYPTTIFINKSGKIIKTKSGFNGPGTGTYFDEFKKEFEQIISQLNTIKE